MNGTFNVVVRWRDQYCNLKATRMEKQDEVVFLYDESGFLGMFDLGAVDALYRTQRKEADHVP